MVNYRKQIVSPLATQLQGLNKKYGFQERNIGRIRHFEVANYVLKKKM